MVHNGQNGTNNGSQPEPLTILIVEDQAVLSLELSWYISQAFPSARVLSASDGVTGLNRARLLNPHLIITDLSIPRMNGYDMVRAVRREDFRQDIHIIGMTGLSPEEELVLAFQSACDDFIPKPFSPQTLIKKIELLLSHHPACR